jgi:hypothetical protein
LLVRNEETKCQLFRGWRNRNKRMSEEIAPQVGNSYGAEKAFCVQKARRDSPGAAALADSAKASSTVTYERRLVDCQKL